MTTATTGLARWVSRPTAQVRTRPARSRGEARRVRSKIRRGGRPAAQSWAVLLGALVLAAGCSSQPAGPAGSPPPAPARKSIQAVEPPDMAQEVSRRPVFRWKLPSVLNSPRMVSLRLSEVGQVEDPRKAADQEKQVAFVSGLAPESPTELDLFNPPPPAIVTSDVADVKQLKGGTWYHWVVRAIGDGEAAGADFFFRTRTQDALPPPAPEVQAVP